MNIKNDKGILTFTISAYDIIHDIMTGEQRDLLIQSLSCNEDIIRNVAEQLIDGCTDDGFSGAMYSDCTSAIQTARKKIAENSGYAVRKTIEGLERRIKTLEADIGWYRQHTG